MRTFWTDFKLRSYHKTSDPGGAARTENDKGDNTKSYARYGQAYSIYTKILATSDVLSTTGANTSMMDSEWDDRSQARFEGVRTEFL